MYWKSRLRGIRLTRRVETSRGANDVGGYGRNAGARLCTLRECLVRGLRQQGNKVFTKTSNLGLGSQWKQSFDAS